MTCQRSIYRVLGDVLVVARTAQTQEAPPDLLEAWLNPGAAGLVRNIRGAIHTVLNFHGMVAAGKHLRTADLTPMASFFYCALFGVVRHVLRRYRATNPMWLKYPRTYRHRARPSQRALHAELERQVDYLAHRLSLTPRLAGLSPESPFTTGNAQALEFDDDLFDGAVTSPPYATRVDYVRGTLPELAVLGVSAEDVERLRAQSTGSPTIKGSHRSDGSELTSRAAKIVLEAIALHASKASRSYYFPWMTNYLQALQTGLQELHRTVRPNCPICVVVQDSYYKEVPIPMQRIVSEMMSAVGRDVRAQYDYSAPNPRRKSLTADAPATVLENMETLLVFT